MTLLLTPLLDTPLKAGMKGLPSDGAHILLSDVANKQWNLLQEDMPLPCAVIKQSALEHNAAWMRDFMREENVHLAPHGKTTMAPQLFNLQLTYGAWGITVATVQQLKVCRRYGVKRVFMANQLVGMDDIHYVAEELLRDESFEFYCIVDSIEGAKRLQQALEQKVAFNELRVLLEIGLAGGRTGCRTADEALKVAECIAEQSCLALYGVECYEGLINTGDAHEDERRINTLLAQVSQTYHQCQSKKLYSDPNNVLLSAGGSAYFDIVAPLLHQVDNASATAIIRSGCYLTHDSLFYERLFENIKKRSAHKPHVTDQLQPALEVWAYVQSVPEPGLAILTAGKRDVSYDIELPVAEQWFRPGHMKQPARVASGMVITALNDQHAYLTFPSKFDLRIGDMIALGVSHPCTTFDKWQLLWLVDDHYNVTSGIRTFF